MRQLFLQLQRHLEDFVEQRNDLLMLIACTNNDVPMVIAVLDSVDQGNTTDIFLSFVDDFTTPNEYVSTTIERLREHHRMVCDALSKEGKPLLSNFPESLNNPRRSPGERLKEAILFARSFLPGDGEHRLIWAMCPPNIVNRQAYLNLISQLAPWHGIQPWMQGIRLIFRGEADTATVFPQLLIPRVCLEPVDFSYDAIEKAWQKEVADESLPEEQRMQALLSLALRDYAYNRLLEAIDRYDTLLAYYQRTNNLEMQAFVLNGLGDVYKRAEQFKDAQYYYECAVTPVTKVNSPLIFHTIVKNLGEVAFKLKSYEAAEFFFDKAEKLASHLLDPQSKAEDLEWRGLSQEKQTAYDRAINSWENAATLSRNTDMPEYLRRNLEHLTGAYLKIGRLDKAATTKAELLRFKGGK